MTTPTSPSLTTPTRRPATTPSPEIQRFDETTRRWYPESRFNADGTINALEHSWIDYDLEGFVIGIVGEPPFFECIRCGFVEGVVDVSEMPWCPGEKPEGKLARHRKAARDAQHLRARAWWGKHSLGHVTLAFEGAIARGDI